MPLQNHGFYVGLSHGTALLSLSGFLDVNQLYLNLRNKWPPFSAIFSRFKNNGQLLVSWNKLTKNTVGQIYKIVIKNHTDEYTKWSANAPIVLTNQAALLNGFAYLHCPRTMKTLLNKRSSAVWMQTSIRKGWSWIYEGIRWAHRKVEESSFFCKE